MTKWQAINLMFEIFEAYLGCERNEGSRFSQEYWEECCEKREMLKKVLQQKLNPATSESDQ